MRRADGVFLLADRIGNWIDLPCRALHWHLDLDLLFLETMPMVGFGPAVVFGAFPAAGFFET